MFYSVQPATLSPTSSDESHRLWGAVSFFEKNETVSQKIICCVRKNKNGQQQNKISIKINTITQSFDFY